MSAPSVPTSQRAADGPRTVTADAAARPLHRRAALDGIRALAVLSVMIYHFGGGSTSWLPGGFLGVDIFFVLSGYLITGLLLSEHARTGAISLRDFWVRRARRLVPALVVVLLAVIGWIWWTAPPESYPNRRADIVWTVGYLANWHLRGSADNYFASYTAASPLRHAWSLAIEEQFYLVWPLLVAVLLLIGVQLAKRHGATEATSKARGSLLPVAAFAIVAALLSAWAMATAWTALSPSAAYYSTWGRVQELFAGALLAILFASYRNSTGRMAAPLRRLAHGWVPVIAGAAAVVVLAVALFTMSDIAPFYYRGGALGVSLITAVLVASVETAPASPLARAFSLPPAVALGRISYGVYLWHWPITVAFPVGANWPLSEKLHEQGQRVVLTLLLATLSFWLVERPIQRGRRVLRNRRRVLAAVAVSMAGVLAAGYAATALPGTMAHQLKTTSDRSCLGEAIDHLIPCVAPEGSNAATATPAFVMLGDSTARGLGHGFDEWAQQTGNTWIEAGWKRCSAAGLLVVPDNKVPDIAATTCQEQGAAQVDRVLATYHPKTALIQEWWPQAQPIWVGDQHYLPDDPGHAEAMFAAYQKLVDRLAAAGTRAVFVEAPPPGDSIGRTIAKNRPAAHARGPVLGSGKYVDTYNEMLKDVVESRPGKADVISISDVLCPNGDGSKVGDCPGVLGNDVVRVDGLHYGSSYAMKLAPIVLQRAGIS